MYGEKMTENNAENNLPIEQHKKYFTAQARRAHVRAYQASGESMVAYAGKHHLVLSTFKGWVTRHGEKVIPAAFVPIAPPKNTLTEIKKIKSLLCCEIYAGDIKIILSEIADIEILIQLIKGLSHANPVKSTGNIVL